MPATKEDLQIRIDRFKKFVRKGYESRLISIKEQFIHMANGGDGSAAMEGEIRESFYPTWEDSDFQTVCMVMGWKYHGEEQ